MLRPMNIVIVQGHPDPAGGHLCHAPADSYAEGALGGGHDVRRVEVAQLEFPLLRTKQDFDHAAVPAGLAAVQQAIGWAAHVVVVYPLWLGGMPALLKGFFEQVARPGFALEVKPDGGWAPALRGKSARVIVTMGMPAFVYRWYFRAHSLKSLERNILAFVGIKPCRSTLIGAVDGLTAERRSAWLAEAAALGRSAR